MLTTENGSIAHIALALMIVQVEEEKTRTLPVTTEEEIEIEWISYLYKAILTTARELTTSSILSQYQHVFTTFSLDIESVQAARQRVRESPPIVREEIRELQNSTHFSQKELEQLEHEYRVLKASSIQNGIDQTAFRRVVLRLVPAVCIYIHMHNSRCVHNLYMYYVLYNSGLNIVKISCLMLWNLIIMEELISNDSFW